MRDDDDDDDDGAEDGEARVTFGLLFVERAHRRFECGRGGGGKRGKGAATRDFGATSARSTGAAVEGRKEREQGG